MWITLDVDYIGCGLHWMWINSNCCVCGFISSRGTNSETLLLGGVDAALIAYQPYVRSASLCSV